jgi:hypothetical protein
MKNRLIMRKILEISQILGSLILTLVVNFTYSPAHATEISSDQRILNNYRSSFNSNDSVMNKTDKKERLKLVVDYVRKELPSQLPKMPNLPSFIRDPEQWVVKRFNSIGAGFSGMWDSTGGDDVVVSVIKPVTALMKDPGEDVTQALWLAPEYHHKGFMPTHDALVMGVKARHEMLDERMKINVHPHIGQNWHSAENFYGADMTIDVRGTRDALDGKRHKLGSISISYNNGDRHLIDKSRGFDMHSEFDFTDHISLTAGISSGSSDSLGNYVLLQYKLSTF